MEHEKLLRIREAIVSFFKIHEKEPSRENYEIWLRKLDETERLKFENLSFERGRQLISFRTYFLEQKGYSINDFLKKHLSQVDFDYCLSIGSQIA